jgi:sulfite exporter TauE/SafE/copper chaperone CopZ
MQTSSSFRIGGMTCVNCRDRIERELKHAAGVEDAVVNFNTGSATVTYDTSIITFDGIKALVENLDYQVLNNSSGLDAKAGRGLNNSSGLNVSSGLNLAGTLVVIFALYALLRGLGIGAAAFPLAEAGMGYGMLFVMGLVTSVHCVAMCGGINLSQSISPSAIAEGPPPEEKRRKVLRSPILYNAGRLVSYTVVGTLAGALGSVVSVSGRFKGAVQIAAGVFMVIMGINMLGLFPALRRFTPRLPAALHRRLGSALAGKNGDRGGGKPLLVGLLNGLMPCGPLQAMQLYALSTGSPLAGGLSMFLFGAGTVPLMFGLGALSSLLSGTAGGPAFRRRVLKAGAVLVTVMGMTMFGYGLNLSGFDFDPAAALMAVFRSPAKPGAGTNAGTNAGINAGARGPAAPVTAPPVENGVQIVNSTLSGGRYPAITVLQGIPVRWTITAPQGSINGCNNSVIIREYGIEYRFSTGENVIEFTPARAGTFGYSCWMGMIRSSITVVEQGQSPAAEPAPAAAPAPAGVTIPTDKIALAEPGEQGRQAAAVNLLDDGIDPAVVVFQKFIPAALIVSNHSLDPGNSRLIFPAYFERLDMEQGDNVIQFTPSGDFDFSTADNVFYGYVKVVDDLDAVDIEGIRADVVAHETLIYPDAYFERGGAAR